MVDPNWDVVLSTHGNPYSICLHRPVPPVSNRGFSLFHSLFFFPCHGNCKNRGLILSHTNETRHNRTYTWKIIQNIFLHALFWYIMVSIYLNRLQYQTNMSSQNDLKYELENVMFSFFNKSVNFFQAHRNTWAELRTPAQHWAAKSEEPRISMAFPFLAKILLKQIKLCFYILLASLLPPFSSSVWWLWFPWDLGSERKVALL